MDYLNSLQRILNELIAENAAAFQDDPINQSCLLRARFDLGRSNEIMIKLPEKILCTGPYKYIFAHI